MKPKKVKQVDSTLSDKEKKFLNLLAKIFVQNIIEVYKKKSRIKKES